MSKADDGQQPPRTLASLALPVYGRSNECAGGYKSEPKDPRGVGRSKKAGAAYRMVVCGVGSEN